jgi:hypothetical protein
VKQKEAKMVLGKRSPTVRNKEGGTPSTAAPKAKGAEPTTEQETLGPAWNHVCGGRVVKAI